MIDNIFIHDAVPTWSGFVYQGQIAVYLAVKKIYELDASGKKEEADHYAIEMEKCEDIAVVYEDKGCRQYKSIHQTKNQADQGIRDYKSPLTQLMMEKGFCRKNGYGAPDAYLHVSRKISINDGKTFEKEMEKWQSEIIRFYETLCTLRRELNRGGDTEEILKNLGKCLKNQPIMINRSEYRKILDKVKKACGEEDGKKDLHKVENGLAELLSFLEEELYIPEIDKDVNIYNYTVGKNYCAGTEVFKYIVDFVIKYKCSRGNFSQEQYEYIADKMLCFVQKKILERHQCMQEGKKATYI